MAQHVFKDGQWHNMFRRRPMAHHVWKILLMQAYRVVKSGRKLLEVGDSSNTARTQAKMRTVSTPGSTRISRWSTTPKGSVEHSTDAHCMPAADLMLNWRLSVSPSMAIILSPSLMT
mmetsp:Transcript_117540/g.204274  ORF Transcript_117540/g.204274 Transcript_117540/m.204274 type:complete len:117 (-) Transcript_117540:213-563(-)